MTEISYILDEHMLKARKPYTISKQREKWTEDEHKKFLEALQLHGRNWRRIEEHIGTKTTIQIRSHAQKFFSKVTRESNNESIQIPPPRPKRKPAHPYPRKSGNEKSGKQILVLKKQEKDMEMVLGEQENSSPTSDLSTELASNGSTSPVISAVGSNGLGISDPMESEQSHEEEEICAESGSPSCLKLFGKTVNTAAINHQNANNNIDFTTRNVEMDVESSTTEQSEAGTAANNNYNVSHPFLYYNYYAQQHLVLWNPYGNMSYPVIKPEPVSPKVKSVQSLENSDEIQTELSCVNNKISNVIGSGRINDEKILRGFVPYKRCVAEIEKVEVEIEVLRIEEGESELSTRLCL
ncbi:hypothetical protein LUZ60_016687 [Juncus effusus]|nr:hypothetical protein LUZ60_016687 [Juncus effusus]